MTKECKVVLNNDAVTVVKFDEKEIQFPSIHRNAKAVFVKVDNGSYSIVDKMENESNNSGVPFQRKPRGFKKATNDDFAEKAESLEDNE